MTITGGLGLPGIHKARFTSLAACACWMPPPDSDLILLGAARVGKAKKGPGIQWTIEAFSLGGRLSGAHR
jgi:hypothetical protein